MKIGGRRRGRIPSIALGKRGGGGVLGSSPASDSEKLILEFVRGEEKGRR